MDRIFVTGGSGFIGTHLTESLLSRGFQLSNYDLKAGRIRQTKKLKLLSFTLSS
ncbi:NAD-dependent epimerase/dehydratase family protein [Paenibacillus pasadenensis]|uniref:NAD-dependent epimerase/dehydratase family protein n=1 Tax=Paenibacillus pasadenensis TaxID=217090 RepID=UPI003341A9A9